MSLKDVWGEMIQRCRNPKNKAFKNYGARGIAVCERWWSFTNFREDMGPQPRGGLLERVDNDRGYSPGNCRWASRQEQNSNRRNCIYVTRNGERVTLKEASRRAGLRYRQVHKRISEYGWTVHRALNTPTGTRRGTA